MTRSKSARASIAHVVGSSATTDAVRGFFVRSAISPNICPGPSSASRNSIPVSGSLRRTATRPAMMTYAASPAPPSRTMIDCGTKSQRCMRRSNSVHSAGERPAKRGMSRERRNHARDIIGSLVRSRKCTLCAVWPGVTYFVIERVLDAVRVDARSGYDGVRREWVSSSSELRF